jgi:hypothetical protein
MSYEVLKRNADESVRWGIKKIFRFDTLHGVLKKIFCFDTIQSGYGLGITSDLSGWGPLDKVLKRMDFGLILDLSAIMVK